MAKILILGGGFAAVSAAETLAARIGEGHELTLVSKNPDFVFFPAIVPMVFGSIRSSEIRCDLRPHLRERNIDFVRGDVREIDTKRRIVRVALDEGVFSILEFDYLLVALGPSVEMEPIPGLVENSQSMLSIDAALKFKRVVDEFQAGTIVFGLCPGASLPIPACESALALAVRFQNEIMHRQISIAVVMPSSLDSAFAGATLFRDIESEFDRLGIRLVSDFPVTRVTETAIFSAHGSSLEYDLLMLMPAMTTRLGSRSAQLVTDLPDPLPVDQKMRVEAATGVYAAGDIVPIPGPRFGYMAMRQGRVAAANILAEVAGREPETSYVHKLAWAINEKYTGPVFFHYGFWDQTLDDFDADALFGMARSIRERYGRVEIPAAETPTFSS